VATGKEAVGTTKPLSDTRVSFPVKVRESIDASHGDDIQILIKTTDDNPLEAVADGDGMTENPETVKEIHEMVSEIHEILTND